MRALVWLKRLKNDKRGNVLAIGAAMLPLVLGAAAVSVDTIQVSLAKRQLQRSADSAALAGAYALVQSQTPSTSVNHDLALNNDVPLSGSATIENAPTIGPFAGNTLAVRVVLNAQRAVPFISFFTGSDMPVRAEATAAIIFAGQYCVISLESGATTGVTFTGNTTANLGCGVASNSTSSAAVSASGSASVTASPVGAVGGVPSSGAYVGTTTLLPYSPPQSDPFADLPTPTVPTACNPELKVQPNDPLRTYQPGCYRGMDIKGAANFAPGEYIIDGQSLSFGSQANVTGTGITFILTSRTAASNPSSIATISMHGGAVVDFIAPTSGTYEGVLMYQDRRALFGDSHINGNSASRFEGGFYFPSRQLTFNGNTGMRTECLQLVARRLVFSGNSRIQNTCSEGGGAQAFDATFVRLVG